MSFYSYINSEYCVEAEHVNRKHTNHPNVRTSTPHKSIGSVKDHIKLMLKHGRDFLITVTIYHNGKEMYTWRNPSFGISDQ